jgi:hypothetical protein
MKKKYYLSLLILVFGLVMTLGFFRCKITSSNNIDGSITANSTSTTSLTSGDPTTYTIDLVGGTSYGDAVIMPIGTSQNVEGGWFVSSLMGGKIYRFEAHALVDSDLPVGLGLVFYNGYDDLIGWSEITAGQNLSDLYIFFGPNTSGVVRVFADVWTTGSPTTSLTSSGQEFTYQITEFDAPTNIVYNVNASVDLTSLSITSMSAVNINIFDPMDKSAGTGYNNYLFMNYDNNGMPGSVASNIWTGSKAYNLSYGATLFVMVMVNVDGNYPNGINNGDLFWSDSSSFNFITSTFVDELFEYDTTDPFEVKDTSTFAREVDFDDVLVNGGSWISGASVQTYSGADITDFSTYSIPLQNIVPLAAPENNIEYWNEIYSKPAYELSAFQIKQAYATRKLPSVFK